MPNPPRVIQALLSDDREERWTAARNAASFPEVEAALTQALQREPDARIREAMLTSLARFGTAAAIETLISLLRSESAAIRTAALDAMLSTEALPTIHAQLLTDADPALRILSCELARSLPAAVASPLLCTLIERETNVNVCAAAIEVLAEVGNSDALATLAHCAERFRDTPFLQFAITTVSARLRETSASARD